MASRTFCAVVRRSNSRGQVTDALGDSITAAREETISVAKLDAALKANVASWDGNTEAIEAALKARMDLGYADDEQRDSLAQLVAVTKDSTAALDIQRTAKQSIRPGRARCMMPRPYLGSPAWRGRWATGSSTTV
jgi:hypothetical protein